MVFTLSFSRSRPASPPRRARTRRRPRLSRIRDCLPSITITVNRHPVSSSHPRVTSTPVPVPVPVSTSVPVSVPLSSSNPAQSSSTVSIPPISPCTCSHSCHVCPTQKSSIPSHEIQPLPCSPSSPSPTSTCTPIITPDATHSSPTNTSTVTSTLSPSVPATIPTPIPHVATPSPLPPPPPSSPSPSTSKSLPTPLPHPPLASSHASPLPHHSPPTPNPIPVPTPTPPETNPSVNTASTPRPETDLLALKAAPSLRLSIGPDIHLTLDLPAPSVSATLSPSSCGNDRGNSPAMENSSNLTSSADTSSHITTSMEPASDSTTTTTRTTTARTTSTIVPDTFVNRSLFSTTGNSVNVAHGHAVLDNPSESDSERQTSLRAPDVPAAQTAAAEHVAQAMHGGAGLSSSSSTAGPTTGGATTTMPTPEMMHCPHPEHHERLCRIDHSLAFTSRMASYDAAVRRSVQLYDFNSNLLLLVTLNDGDRTHESHASHSAGETSRDGSESASESVAHDSVAADSEVEDTESGQSDSDIEQSQVSYEDSHDILLKQLENGNTSPNEVVEMALHRCQAQALSPEAHNLLMYTLESGLEVIDTSTDAAALHPDVRVEAHHTLSKFFAEKGIAYRDKALSHCRRGLLMLHPREKHSPRTAADLHILSASLLVATRDPSKMGDIFSHIRSARLALFACLPAEVPEIQFQIYVTLGDAYSVCMSNPACENLLAGYDAYMSAVEMVRMGAIDADSTWMHLTCLAAQLALRFLRHKRMAHADPKSACATADAPACRRDATLFPQMRRVNVDDVLTIAEDVRQKLARMLEFEETDYSLQQRLSVAHEVVARCHVERSYIRDDTRVRDLNRAVMVLTKALRSCEWSDEYAGQRYSSLVELLDESRRRLREAEAEALAKGEVDDVEGEAMWVDEMFDDDGVKQRTGSSGGKKDGSNGEVDKVDKAEESSRVAEKVPPSESVQQGPGPMPNPGGDAPL